jgi:hypothetical protein
MTTRAIIIAAGEATRWNNYLNTPKHLISIEGEILLERTVRLLIQNNIKDIFVVGPDDDRYKVEGSKLYVPTKNLNYADADKFLNSESLWNTEGRTLVLYGDVYFSDNCIEQVVNYTNTDWTLFCRFTESCCTGSVGGECFVQSFYPNDIDRHKENLLYIAKLSNEGILRRCGGWEHFRAMNGVTGSNLNKKKYRFNNAVVIDDWTEDFDYPADYDMWIENRKKANSK